MGALLDLALEALEDDDRAEPRRQKVLSVLDAHPEMTFAVTTDAESDPEAVLLTLAIRGKATCEFKIDRDRYDPFILLEIVQKHDGDAARVLLDLMRKEGEQVH